MKRILVVEDDPDPASLLAFALRLQGYSVEVAENGREASTVLEAQSFDAIVLDWNMPGMRGEEFSSSTNLVHLRRGTSLSS